MEMNIPPNEERKVQFDKMSKFLSKVTNCSIRSTQCVSSNT
jgi:hypothetical protein